MLIRGDKYERRAKLVQELAAGQPVVRPFGDTVTLFAFLCILLFLFIWLFSGALLWSLASAALIFGLVTALSWHLRQRLTRRRGMEL